MELVIGIVLDKSRNPAGYMVFDTSSNTRHQQKELTESNVYNKSLRNQYTVYSTTGRILRNKEKIITYINGDHAWSYSQGEGWHEFKGRLTDPNILIVNPATLAYYEEPEIEVSNEVSITPDIQDLDNLKITGVQITNDNRQSVTHMCPEYLVCRELKLNGVRSLCDLNYYTFGRLVDTLYFAELPLQWSQEKFGSQLKMFNRIPISDSYTILECKSNRKFNTQSIVVQGSRFNTIYLLVNQNDDLVRSVTSYASITDILDTILSLDDYEDNPEYKEIYTIISSVHLKNPRCDIEWVGAAINRKTGCMYLASRIRELGKTYWLQLLMIANYAEFLKWAIGFDTSEDGAYFDDMLHGIECIIRKTHPKGNKLTQVIENPQLMLDSQYKFAI